MADIELVIKIDEDTYKEIKKIVADGNEMCFMQKLIANSTPLPKGHGRLIDADELIEGKVANDWTRIQAECANTIIEAEVITRGNCMMCGKELTEGLFFCKECENKANGRK